MAALVLGGVAGSARAEPRRQARGMTLTLLPSTPAPVALPAASAIAPSATARSRYVSAKDTAKLVRMALKSAFGTTFPSVKFSVRTDTYAGGASIDVRWTDGPTARMVEGVISAFEGATFDAMQDLKSVKTHVVNGERVVYGADYCFTRRETSAALLAAAADEVAAVTGIRVAIETQVFAGAPVARVAPSPEAAQRITWVGWRECTVLEAVHHVARHLVGAVGRAA